MRTDQPERFLFLFSSNFRVFLLTLFPNLQFPALLLLDGHIMRGGMSTFLSSSAPAAPLDDAQGKAANELGRTRRLMPPVPT